MPLCQIGIVGQPFLAPDDPLLPGAVVTGFLPVFQGFLQRQHCLPRFLSFQAARKPKLIQKLSRSRISR